MLMARQRFQPSCHDACHGLFLAVSSATMGLLTPVQLFSDRLGLIAASMIYCFLCQVDIGSAGQQ